jgi:hypothetical protein
MNVKRSALATIFCCVFSVLSFAQKNEVSFSVGAITTFNQNANIGIFTCPIVPVCGSVGTNTSTGVALAGNYARQLFNFHAGSLDLEIPVVGVPSRDIGVSLAGVTLPGTLSTWTFFFTPSARVKLLPSGPVSPFFSFGGGLAHNGSTFTIAPIFIAGISAPGFSFSNSNNSGALQFGAGADFKTPLPHLAVRAELRDFWAESFARPSSQVTLSPERVHNLFAAGGVVFRF